MQANATIANRGGSAVITAPTAGGKALVRGVNYAQLTTRAPEFKATVTGASSGRVIVDGIVYPSTLSNGVLTADLAKAPLQENFHVVTFEAEDSAKKVTRSTNIFYVGAAPAIHKVEFMDPDRTTFISTIYVDNNTVIAPGAMPVKSTKGATVTGWTIFGTDQPFNATTSLARSYRLVATVEGGNDDGSSSGCNAGILAGLLLLPVWLIRKR